MSATIGQFQSIGKVISLILIWFVCGHIKIVTVCDMSSVFQIYKPHSLWVNCLKLFMLQVDIEQSPSKWYGWHLHNDLDFDCWNYNCKATALTAPVSSLRDEIRPLSKLKRKIMNGQHLELTAYNITKWPNNNSNSVLW